MADGHFEKKKVCVRSEMARNAIANEFRTCSYFEKKWKEKCKQKLISDIQNESLFWSEIARNARKTGELQDPGSFYYL